MHARSTAPKLPRKQTGPEEPLYATRNPSWYETVFDNGMICQSQRSPEIRPRPRTWIPAFAELRRSGLAVNTSVQPDARVLPRLLDRLVHAAGAVALCFC